MFWYPCDNCAQPIWAVAADTRPGKYRPTQVDNGVTWFLGGGYGEFIDSMPEDDHKVVLCHDCVVRVFEALPGVVAKFEEGDDYGAPSLGWHPYEGDEPCCRWGWT